MNFFFILYKGESKSNAFFFSTGIITDTGTCIIHQNKAGPLWITSLLLNTVTISLNSNVPPLNESLYPSLVKFCWLFFKWIHHWSFHFLTTNVCHLNPLSWGWRDESGHAKSGEYEGCGKVVYLNEAIVSLSWWLCVVKHCHAEGGHY